MNAKDKVARVMMVVDTISNENTPEEVLHLLSTSEVARAAQPFATRSLASVQAAGPAPAHVRACVRDILHPPALLVDRVKTLRAAAAKLHKLAQRHAEGRLRSAPWG
ncbi:hypothetical protein CHLRE_12g525827v5 [Chlamydomonas reinhardtii]|uniref:Uncharacterized protein n=1 Tax=Chlamydomonas reinhardtii TaxID=3055 RepID=A0A2K3D4E2_CHLRE|nr:uncharacterized protein CHLRE_12g525827v5 [Chlamydomonas reinhardtii]PNW75404.1 hypothetical protein CHLRE_12g525827v5 [Chlamydomonas reinhardtii]